MKTLILVLFLLAFSMQLQAQEAEFGAKLGFHQASIDGDSSDDFEYAFGPAIAAFVKVPLGTSFSFQPELQYGAYGANSGEVDTRMKQVNFPLKVNWFPGANGNNDGFKVNLGPQIGFVVQDELKGGGEDIDLSDLLQDNGGSFEEVDLGATLNLGYEFDFGLWLETGAYHSVLPIWETGTGLENYNTVGTFTVGYNFNAYD